MNCTSPSQMKYLGTDLSDMLLMTGTKELLEASRDENWGIGLALQDDQLWEKSSRKGVNLMGKILMRIREHLK